MKKLTLLIFLIITVLFVILVWHMVTTQYMTNEPISLTQAATFSSGIQNPHITADGKIDINSATARELMLIPGIGETLAERIITYRNINGPFMQHKDLLKVKGISNDKLQSMYDYIYID